MSEPDVSIIITAYNSSEFISSSIKSILNQSYKNFELIVVDDGSTDDTWNLIKSFEDDRIVPLQKFNEGAAAGRNFGIKYAKADLIAILDSDDLANPERLEIQVNFMDQYSDYVCIGSQGRAIDISGNFVYEINLPLSDVEIRSHLPYMPFIHPSIMFRKKPFYDIGGYPEYMLKAQDRVMINKLSSVGKFLNLKERLINYRIVPGSNSSRNTKEKKIIDNIINKVIKNDCIAIEDYQIIKNSIKNKTENDKHFDYHIFLSKKYLWNNYSLEEARDNIIKALNYKKFNIEPYLLSIVSCLPEKIIENLYRISKS